MVQYRAKFMMADH